MQICRSSFAASVFDIPKVFCNTAIVACSHHKKNAFIVVLGCGILSKGTLWLKGYKENWFWWERTVKCEYPFVENECKPKSTTLTWPVHPYDCMSPEREIPVQISMTAGCFAFNRDSRHLLRIVMDLNTIPHHPCMVYFPKFTMNINQMYPNITIHEWYGYAFRRWLDTLIIIWEYDWITQN